MKWKLTVGIPSSVDTLPILHSRAQRILLKNLVALQTATNIDRNIPGNYTPLVKVGQDGRTAIVTAVGGKLWLNPRSRNGGADGGGKAGEEDFALLLGKV